MGLKGNLREEQVASTGWRGEGPVSMPLRATVETAFRPTVNNRVYWSIIKEVVFCQFHL
jgi:acyl-ACP thioesterase